MQAEAWHCNPPSLVRDYGGRMPVPISLPIPKDGLVVIVVETRRGSGNKLKFDAELGLYRLDRVLQA